MPRDFQLFQVAIQPSPLLENLFPKHSWKKLANEAVRFKPIYDKLTSSRCSVDDTAISNISNDLRNALKNVHHVKTSSLPLNFPSQEEEVGFIGIFEALRLGSGYDQVLAQVTANRRSAYETIQFGLLGMFISSKPPYNADILIDQARPHAISTFFEFPIHESKPLSFAKAGGVYQDVDGPLLGFAQHICKCMNEIGILLRARQMTHFGQLLIQIFNKSDKKIESFVTLLGQALPLTFNDVANHEVNFSTKARRLAGILHGRFPQLFPFETIMQTMLAPADAELVYALRKLGVLKLRPELQELVDVKHEVLGYGLNDEYALRIGALMAVHELTKGDVRSDIASDWLISKANEIENSLLSRHLCETQYY